MLNAPESISQRTADWRQARAGSVTGTGFAAVIARGRGTAESKERLNYRLQLIAERLTGVPYDGYRNAAMEWGRQWEPHARAAYESATGRFVEEVGFVQHPEIEWCGVSPDGLVHDNGVKGIIEIKCPHSINVHMSTLAYNTATFAAVLTGKTIGEVRLIPPEYIPQVQGNMWVTGAQFCDFVSFDPRYPKHLRLLIRRVDRDENYITQLTLEVTRFLEEVESGFIQFSADLKDQTITSTVEGESNDR